MDSITEYSGLLPAAFFIIVTLMVVIYKVVYKMFVAVGNYAAIKRTNNDYAPREPVQLRDVTEDQLRAYDGSDSIKPLLMAIKGQIYSSDFNNPTINTQFTKSDHVINNLEM
ncbi:membrane steroid-binding protein 2-like [Cornus florida]|uniref:membrane steroid-binding protein 2-like n=1 Tax=Cornus florida TaxID=4283 RepID=UPI00289704FA|nr:membrane steroid-binding protein 2-like [Cornus florida]